MTTTLTVADAFNRVFGPDVPIRLEAYDGSVGGNPQGRPLWISQRGLRYVLTAPGGLGAARAYLQGDLLAEGIDEGDPYEVLKLLEDGLHPKRPDWRDLPELASFVAQIGVRPPEPPREELPGMLHRLRTLGTRHNQRRDPEAIRHHYDVSNAFYELVLGPSMTYTCALYPHEGASLEEAQDTKHDLVARKLGLRPGMRLLDVGCGWGGMVRHAVKHYGVTALGVTLSREQAAWAQAKIEEEGLADRAEVRFLDYRDVTEGGFDAVSSIGLTEHIGVRQYPAYFAFLRSRLREGGRLLNHCITRPDNKHPGAPSRGFINRYVFPDGELTGSGDIIRAMENEGFEVRHHENLREHYALTLGAWCANLSANWEAAVAEAGPGIARVWGLYLAGSRLYFERNRIQLHQVLATNTAEDGSAGYPLRHSWAVEAPTRRSTDSVDRA